MNHIYGVCFNREYESCPNVYRGPSGFGEDNMMNNKVQKKIWYAPNMKEAYGHEEIQSVQNCLEDGWLAPGPKTELFESMVAKAFGKSYGIMVNSGSSANLLALACLDFKPGDEIITPACTFATTVAPIIQVGGMLLTK